MKGVTDDPYCKNVCPTCIAEIEAILRGRRLCELTREERNEIWRIIERMKGVRRDVPFCDVLLPIPGPCREEMEVLEADDFTPDYCNIDGTPSRFCADNALLTNNRALSQPCSL